MAGRPYSERLLHAFGEAIWTSYTVPAGYRAVVKSVVLVNNSGAAAQIGVFMAGRPFYIAVLQAYSAAASPAMTVAVYSGESLDAYTDLLTTVVTVGGFVFEDPTGAEAPPGTTARTRRPPPRIQPWDDQG